jgi:hypothetical protein
MSGSLTGPELSRDAVRERRLALEDVVAAHAPKRPNSKITTRLIDVCLSILFFMHEVILHEQTAGIARVEDLWLLLVRCPVIPLSRGQSQLAAAQPRVR